MSDNPLSRALGIGPVQEIEIDLIDVGESTSGSYHADPKPQSNVEIVDPKDDTESEYAKAKIKTMINYAVDSVSDLADLAKQSDSPRAFEVLATMIKTVVDAAKDVAAIEEKTKKAPGPEHIGQQVNNQNLFVGTTTELAKLVEAMQSGKMPGTEE